MTEPGGIEALPPKDSGADPRSSVLDSGRIRLCDDLIVSVNRSWQVKSPTPEPPVAAFKAMAPLAYWANGEPDASDIYLAAVASHDAWWLGFEAESAPHAVIPEINGRNALTGRAGDTRPGESPNCLIVPDQPWFDATRDKTGLYHQLVPSYAKSNGPGAILRLTAYTLAEDALTRPPDADIDDVQPLYGAEAPSPKPTPHPWPGRALANPAPDLEPCGRVTVYLFEPEQFQELTGEALDLAAFAQKGEAPAPHDPFQ